MHNQTRINEKHNGMERRSRKNNIRNINSKNIPSTICLCGPNEVEQTEIKVLEMAARRLRRRRKIYIK